MLEDVKTVLRISNNAYDAEIEDLIEAAKMDLESMTKKKLLAYANDLGIEGLNGRMLKADIIERIKEGM